MGLVYLFDEAVIDFTRRRGLLLLRIALGAVFGWFGGLKVAGASPVEGLVSDIVFWLPPNVAVVGAGLLEILIALGLISGVAIRLTLLLFFVQMLGTLSVLVLRPDLAFEAGNPLRLTVMGEFVIKNLVLITAGIAIVGSVPKAAPEETLPKMMSKRAEED